MRTSILAAALILCSCASAVDLSRALRPVELNTLRDRYDGTDVTVYGYMINEPESRGLWQSRADYKVSAIDRCVSLMLPTGADLVGFSEQYVVVRGRYLKRLPSSTVQLASCNYLTLKLVGRPLLAPAPR